MSDKKNSDSRRKLLKSIAAGSGAVIAGKGLPDSWSRPVVDAVMLPAHAKTSLRQYNNIRQQMGTGLDNKNNLAGVLGSLLQSAQAQTQIQRFAISCISENPDGTVNVAALILANDSGLALYSAENVPVNGTLVPLTFNGRCSTLETSYFGLIKNAMAGGVFTDLEVRIDSLGAAALGQYYHADPPVEIPIDAPLGSCSAPQCPTPPG